MISNAYVKRGFIKGWLPGKLTGCQLDHAWQLLLLNQVVFLQESVNINNLYPAVKTEYPPIQNLNETPGLACIIFIYKIILRRSLHLSSITR